jgi:hypothetical protein
MQLRDWLTKSHTSIKGFARRIKVERAMVYRYFAGTIPRAKTIRRIEVFTDGAVTAQDFYIRAVQRMNGTVATPAAGGHILVPATPAEHDRAALGPPAAHIQLGGLATPLRQTPLSDRPV